LMPGWLEHQRWNNWCRSIRCRPTEL